MKNQIKKGTCLQLTSLSGAAVLGRVIEIVSDDEVKMVYLNKLQSRLETKLFKLSDFKSAVAANGVVAVAQPFRSLRGRDLD